MGDVKWKPAVINNDHPIDLGTVLGGMFGYGFSKVTRGLSDQNVDKSVSFYYYSRYILALLDINLNLLREVIIIKIQMTNKINILL